MRQEALRTECRRTFSIQEQELRCPAKSRRSLSHVLHPDGKGHTHQIKTIDYRERGTAYKTKIPEEEIDFLIDIMDRVRAFIIPIRRFEVTA